MKIYLLFFFFTYLVLTMILPTWRVKKQTGKNAFVVPKDDSAAGFIGKIFRLLFLMAFVALAVHAFFPGYEKYLLPAYFMENEIVMWIGMAILHISLLIIVVAQIQMARSWRIGFDEKEKTELVEKGLFRISRNPIFLGMVLTMLGLFLVLPNAVTLLAMVMTYVVLQIQIRMEEEYLRKVQGEEYLDYLRRVRRWI